MHAFILNEPGRLGCEAIAEITSNRIILSKSVNQKASKLLVTAHYVTGCPTKTWTFDQHNPERKTARGIPA